MGKKRRRFLQKNRRLQQGVLRWVNLRPEEAERTFLMFAFYTVSYIAILWLEVSAAVLFIGEYGANSLPFIYLASSGMGAGLGIFYSWLQRFLPLHRVIVITPVLMAIPLALFKLGVSPIFLGGYSVFLIRLWLDALYTLNELNTSITANQIFNIREIKRTFPFISSGVLLADVLSGLSLPILRKLFGLENVIFLASIMLLIGAGILLYLVRTNKQAFPDSTRKKTQDAQPTYAARRLKGPLRLYVALVVVFFAMIQSLWFNIDFQYLSQLEQNFDVSDGAIADFLALFSACLGFAELLTQMFASSRIVERLGIFDATMLLPASILGISGLSMAMLIPLFWGVVVLRFVDEWLRYTILAGTAPVLFQPVPDHSRDQVQEWVRGVAEPIATGFSGVLILVTIWLCNGGFWGIDPVSQSVQNWIFVAQIAGLAAIALVAAHFMRSRYTDLLVLGAAQGLLQSSDSDSRAFRRTLIDAIDNSNTQTDKKQCIQLLTNLDPNNVCKVLAPRLRREDPPIQRLSLEVMLDYPDPAYVEDVRSLLNDPVAPDVFALAMRYVWLLEERPNMQELRQYLQPDVDAVIRGTAAALMLRQGNSQEKSEATNMLRRMLTNTDDERERLMGCRALEDAVYLQALRLYIPDLLRDRSLRVRCAVLDAIAATHLEEYYSAIIRALHYSSTREAAIKALTRLGSDGVPMLVNLADDSDLPNIVRTGLWKSISRIGTDAALSSLVHHLMSSWGPNRRSLLRALLSAEDEDGIEAVTEILGRRGVENLINQELFLIGQTYAALVDFPTRDDIEELELLRRALVYQQRDAEERIFLLMRFLYPNDAIQAASFNVRSKQTQNVARGLEILDNTIDIQKKQTLLLLLESQLSDREKLKIIAPMIGYEPMSPGQRLRFLLELRQFISDWALACCFHFARRSHRSVTLEHMLYGLRHQINFVREAALMYLSMASPRVLNELLPRLQNDPDPSIAIQVRRLQQELSHSNGHRDTQPYLPTNHPNGRSPLTSNNP